MPIRFDLPGLGRNIGPLKAHQWQVDVAYRYLYTDQFYVGSEINDGAGPFGQGPSKYIPGTLRLTMVSATGSA